MNRWQLLACGIIVGGSVAAQAPSPAQILEYKPTQKGVVCDMPAAEKHAKCKVEVSKKPAGFLLYDDRGLITRRFVDSDTDGKIDTWSYYLNGIEVYRDLDTNKNEVPDQCRWLNLGGSKWGVDANEDGKIEKWNMISAEETTAEVAAAIASRDSSRMMLVMMNEADMQTLGLNEKAIERVKAGQVNMQKHWQEACQTLPETAVWTRMDASKPCMIPASDIGAATDLLVYHNTTIITEAAKEAKWLRATEIVRVGDTWKILDVPSLIDPNKPAQANCLLAHTLDGSPSHDPSKAGDVNAEPGTEEKIALLQKHDAAIPGGDDPKSMAEFHVKRADICAAIGKMCKEVKNQAHWYKQTADSLNAAAQTGQSPDSIQTLMQYADGLDERENFKAINLGAYFRFRGINAQYTLDVQDPKKQSDKVQEAFVGVLKQFVEKYPTADDTDDALWQIGNGLELSSKEEEAIRTYRQLAENFPKSTQAAKAAGAVRRLESTGNPFVLAGKSIEDGAVIDVAKYARKIVVVNYWASFAEPCKADMATLAKLQEKYKAAGLEVISVCVDQKRESGVAQMQQLGVNWPVIFEPGSMDSPAAVQYGIISLPYTFLIDREGRVERKNIQVNQLDSELDRILSKEKVATKSGDGEAKK